MLELAEKLNQPVSLQLWGPEGTLSNSAAHIEVLQAQLASEHVRIDEVPVNLDAIEDIERVAGELIAWPIESLS
ncbi:unannotated protein [freshwater metagenome]|uniref:Unannotated protein n=1 Tax=freshwater metagenome TaxID=449393 RepID=A0A6J6QF96_9ZZZZ